MYKLDEIDFLQADIDSVLYSARNIYNKLVELVERHEEALTAASGVTGIRYDRDRVQTSHSATDGSLIRLVELDEEVDRVADEYSEAVRFLDSVFKTSGLTDNEYKIMKYRYIHNPVMTFQRIADELGDMDRKRAYYLYTRAYVRVAQRLDTLGKLSHEKPDSEPLNFNYDPSVSVIRYGELEEV